MPNSTNNQATGWVGWVYFAAILTLFSGIFQIVNGLTALLNDKFYTVTANSLVVFDITTWGWIHLVLGLFALCVGISLFSGSVWARIVAVIVASLAFIAQFAFISAYPIWSVIILLLCLFIIYALIVHGDEVKIDK